MRAHLLFAAAVLFAAPAFAQTAAAPAPAAAPAAAPAPSAASAAAPAPSAASAAAPAMTKDGKPLMADVRARCKAEADAAQVKGPARRTAMADCMIKQRPDKAAAIHCMMDPSLKGLTGDPRKTAFQACMSKAKV